MNSEHSQNGMSRTEAPDAEKEVETIHHGKYFGHVTINWRISNFCLRTCKENFFIHSQDFYIKGATLTKWKMILNPKTNDGRITLSLRRLKLEPGPETVSINFRFILTYNGTIDLMEEGCEVFQMDSTHIIDIHETDNVYKNLRPFDLDELSLSAQLIVFNENTITKVHVPPEFGIKTFSQDLLQLYTLAIRCDVVLKTFDRCIRAHKVILHCRNLIFAELLNKQHGNEVIDLSQFKSETVDKILRYIYSGGVESLLKEPSIDLCKGVMFFSIHDALFYYLPDEIHFHTKIDVQTVSYLWSVPNFSSPNEFASPVLKEDSYTTWQIHVSSNFRFDGTEYVSFAAGMVDGAKPQGICIEFGVIDANQNILCLNRIIKNIEENESCGRKLFVERLRQEIDPFIENGTLNVVVRIRMAPGTYDNSSELSLVQFTTANKSENPYCDLSNNVMTMVKSDKFSDVILRTTDGTIMSHKCILFTRSTFFAKKISEMENDSNEINVSSTLTIINSMLNYIYSGQIILEDYTDFTFYTKLTIAANYLGISSYKASVSQALQKIMSVSNASSILIYADKLKDLDLKFSAMVFIRVNFIAVHVQTSWINMAESHPLLYEEALAFVIETVKLSVSV